MKGIPEEIIKKYVDEIPDRYESEIKPNFLTNSCDKEKVEDLVRKAYDLEDDVEIKEFVWIDNPVQAKEVMGEDQFTYPSYFNINWLFFFKTYYETLKREFSEGKLGEEFNQNFFSDNEKIYKQSCYIYEVMKDIFGINEIDGVVYLIKKPNSISIVGDELHSLEGPSVDYGGDGEADLYHIEGVEMTPELWVSTVKTIDEGELKEDGVNIDNLKKNIKFVESRIGEVEPMNVDKAFQIDNLEQKSKAIKYMGYDKILEKADVLDEETIITHKGETKVYQLLEIDLGLEVDDRGEITSDVKSRFVKVTCHSTDRDYILQVDPRSEQCETALGAVAWTNQNPITKERCTVDEYLQMVVET